MNLNITQTRNFIPVVYTVLHSKTEAIRQSLNTLNTRTYFSEGRVGWLFEAGSS